MAKLLFLTLLFSFSSLYLNAQTTYGMVTTSASDRDAITTEQLLDKLQKKSRVENIIVRSEIAEVSQRDGSWMRLTSDGAYPVIVIFIDHAFVVPKDLAGKKGLIYGSASLKTVSVEDLKKQARDAGRTDAEVASIKKPKVQATIEAVGVKVE